MYMSVTSAVLRLPSIPPHYMRAEEQKHLREMTEPVSRSAVDHRSADRIIEQSAVTRRFLDGREHYLVGDDLKLQVGDWTNANPAPQARADAAYNLDKVLRFIDNVDDRTLNASVSRNGQIDGFSESGYSYVDNSEASLLRRFSWYGYEELRHQPT